MKNKKILLLVVLIILTFTLTGCRYEAAAIVPDASFSFKWIYKISWWIAAIMGFFGKMFGNSFGWAIIFTTLVVRTIAWPIYAKSNDMSLKMKIAQPEIQKVQMKYALRKDPASQQRMQLELMQVYKKHKINFLGCLLPFLQMPIFISMYRVVTSIVLEGGKYTNSVSNSMFLGINLAATESSWVNYVFAIIVGGTMFLLQTISTKQPKFMKNTGRQNLDEKAQQQEKTMKFVSYFMVFMMVIASFSSVSLAFYWIIGNIYSLGQTLLGRKLQEIKYYKSQDEIIYKG